MRAAGFPGTSRWQSCSGRDRGNVVKDGLRASSGRQGRDIVLMLSEALEALGAGRKTTLWLQFSLVHFG